MEGRGVTFGVVHMGQVAGSGFFVKVASGVVVVDLISEGDFRTFQKDLVIIGTKKIKRTSSGEDTAGWFEIFRNLKLNPASQLV